MLEGIKHSCDVYFYNVARQVGIDGIAAMARRLRRRCLDRIHTTTAHGRGMIRLGSTWRAVGHSSGSAIQKFAVGFANRQNTPTVSKGQEGRVRQCKPLILLIPATSLGDASYI